MASAYKKTSQIEKRIDFLKIYIKKGLILFNLEGS